MKGVIRFALGSLAALAGYSLPTQAAAQVAAGKAPLTWIAYAKAAGDTIRNRIESDDPAAVRFKAYLDSGWQDAARPAPVLALQVWVDATGVIARVAFPPFAHEAANADLTALLVGQSLGVPPKDILLPLRLSVSLALTTPPADAADNGHNRN